MEEDFKLVREFIKDNPGVSLEIVVEATGVKSEIIREFIKQGDIKFAEHAGPALECRKCGKPIYRGEYCIMCGSEIADTFKASQRAGVKQRQEAPKPTSFSRSYRDKKR
jgi:cbb3-type cytochrome oxidase cytochrome c subunit